MTRRALARVAPVLLLVMGSFGAVGLAAFDTAPLVDSAGPAGRDHAPAVAADVATSDALVMTTSRPSGDSGHAANRLFSIALAALVALVALLAARRARLLVAFAAHRNASLEARRRGPPLLRCV